MRSLVANFLRRVKPNEVSVAANFIIGRVFPEWDPRSLHISFRSIFKLLEELRLPPSIYERAYSTAIDSGEAVRQILEQTRVQSESLGILEVYEYFIKIAASHGKGSKKGKEDLFRELLFRTDPIEAKFIVKSVLGEMRHGVGEGLMLDGIARAAHVPEELVRRAHMLTGDLGKVASIALTEGESGLRKISLVLFRPIKPMLAQTASSLEEAWQELNGELALEYKYDGARVQIHKSEKRVKIYSRRLTDITEAFPEIAEELVKLPVNKMMLEGEVIGVGPNGRPLPFQHIMRRLTRVHQIARAMKKIPIRLHLFDCLMIENELLIGSPYETRWRILRDKAPAGMLASRLIPHSLEEGNSFFHNAVEEGHEGLMAKGIFTIYTPGIRGKNWLKIKLANTLDLVILAADWGYGRRHKWLSNYHLGVLDESSGRYLPVGKTFKGLKDQEFQSITEQLLSIRLGERGKTVYVQPKIVVEVAYNEIQQSPHYSSGMALRFARITRIRYDKLPTQATTLRILQNLYRKESTKKGRVPGVDYSSEERSR